MTRGPPYSPRHALILIVDDDADNRAIMEIVLSREGFVTAIAGTGREALDRVAREPPDLVLLDLMLPDMSGYQVTATLKGNPGTSKIPIVMLTGMSDRAAYVRALGLGVADFLTKPIDRAELCTRVTRALGARTHSREPVATP